MEIIRIDVNNFNVWRSQISGLFQESVKINFPDSFIDNCYGNHKCEEVFSYLKNGSAVVFAAVEQNNLKGWIWCHQIVRMNIKRFHIAEIAVNSDCHNLGIGSELLNSAEIYARKQGITEMDLLVTATNVGAVKFYENASFVPERFLMKKVLK